MVKYEYDVMEMTRNSRIALHVHPVTAPAPTAHAHCEPILGIPVHEHYRHIELTIHEALEEHLDRWARDIDLTCERLRPLH